MCTDTTRNDKGNIHGSKSYEATKLNVREVAKKSYRYNEKMKRGSKQLLKVLNKQKTSWNILLCNL